MTYFFKNVYINDKFSLLASSEKEPIVKKYTDKFVDSYYLEEKSIELAEGEYQNITITGLLNKNKLTQKDISLLVNSDLQNQILASSLSASKYSVPMLGIYSACASFVEGLIIASNFISNKSQNIVVTVSGHNLVSEKQFRFPIEYGAVRKMVNSFTATGSVSTLVSNKKSNIKIESATIGNVITTDHKDANDMGSCMAPAAAEVINRHLIETNRESNYYDVILTGDLGVYGTEIMKKYYENISKKKLKNVVDAGSIFYKEDTIYAGASGPACLPLILFDYILKQNKYKKILVCATGALHSSVSCNLGEAMPGVAHVISLEVL